RSAIFQRIHSSKDEETRATICIEFYRNKVASKHSTPILDSLISMYVDKRRILEQSTSNLMANLSKVTNGALGEMLSPSDPNDTRKSFDMASVLSTNKVLV
ncbi:hypothetical protein, partial [Vibrio splendidus]